MADKPNSRRYLNILETEGMTRVGFEKSSQDFPVFNLVVFKIILRENNGSIFFH